MSLTLILTRHAKSDWGNPMQADRDRPLNGRGNRDAPRIGAWLRQEGHIPAAAIVSAARRTQETWSLLAEGMEADVPVEFIDALYHADAETILDVVRSGQANPQILIGHNPGIAEAAHRFVTAPPRHPRFLDYPTCATLVLEFEETDWRSVDWQSGRALKFITPHDL